MPQPRRPSGADILDTETRLVAQAQAGDMDAVEQLAGAHADRLFAVLLRLLGNRSEAEDVAQEVMLRARRGIGRFHGRSPFFTWLYRIAINEANRSLERTARRPVGVSIDAEVLQVPADARDEPSRRLEQTQLRNALNRPWPACHRTTGRPSCCETSRACPRKRPRRSSASAWPRSRAACTRRAAKSPGRDR